MFADDGLAPAAVVRPSQSTAEVLAVATALEKGLSQRRAGAGGAGAGRESASLASLETPLQRYHRLASEVSALEAELAAVAAADAKRPAKATPVDPAAGVWRGITAGVSELGGRLERLQPSVAALAAGSSASADPSSLSAAAAAAASRGSEPSPSHAADPSGGDGLGLDGVIASLERMAGEMELATVTDGAAGGGSGARHDDARDGGSSGKGGSAESGSAAARSTAVAVDVESRIAALETALLVSAPLASASASATGGSATASAVSSRLTALESRVALLTEPGALEAVAARAKAAAAVVADASAAARSASSSAASASSTAGAHGAAAGAAAGFIAISDSRIAAAATALERWDSVAAALPHIADRLASLRDVHREAAAAPRRITALEAAVRSTATELDADGAVLRELRAGLADLARTVKANLQLLPGRSA